MILFVKQNRGEECWFTCSAPANNSCLSSSAIRQHFTCWDAAENVLQNEQENEKLQYRKPQQQYKFTKSQEKHHKEKPQIHFICIYIANLATFVKYKNQLPKNAQQPKIAGQKTLERSQSFLSNT